MIKYRFENSGWRPDLTGKKIIDIGGANSFANGLLDAVVDIREPQASATHKFVGDIDMPYIWNDIFKHVSVHGKWDYAICTHTLEDISNPLLVSKYISTIAKEGIIVIPSKYREFGRFAGKFRGFPHHKWIFDIIDGEFIAFPKYAMIEDSCFDPIPNVTEWKEELIVEWVDKIDLKIVNDGLPFGTSDLSGDDHMFELYKKMIN